MSETDSEDVRFIAEVQLLDECTEEEERELIRRLDDGNEFPGLITEKEGETLWVSVDD